MSIANISVTLIIILAVIMITMPLFKRMRSKETCCGTEKVRVKRKKLKTVAGSYRLSVDGMHCSNCRKNAMDAINSIDGLSCRVDLEKKEALIEYESVPKTEEAIAALAAIGFLAVPY